QGKLVDAPNIPHTREKIDVLSSIFSCMRNIYVFKKKMSCMPDIFSPQELHFNNELLESPFRRTRRDFIDLLCRTALLPINDSLARQISQQSHTKMSDMEVFSLRGALLLFLFIF
ncbi:MAG: hypothetical protein J5973_01925, partial [Eubacterium sp.]|nr:hypothetical protein [Eubacterium sp.]